MTAKLRPGHIVITAEEAERMGMRCPTGDHEGCKCGGCVCGCHTLNPWPWETGDEDGASDA